MLTDTPSLNTNIIEQNWTHTNYIFSERWHPATFNGTKIKKILGADFSKIWKMWNSQNIYYFQKKYNFWIFVTFLFFDPPVLYTILRLLIAESENLSYINMDLILIYLSQVYMVPPLNTIYECWLSADSRLLRTNYCLVVVLCAQNI